MSDKANQSLAASQPSAETEEMTASILVVDDSRTSATKLAKAVIALGHRAAKASDGGEALRRLGEEEFDAVLLDIVMPGLDGYGVLEAMGSDDALSEIPVIVVSSLDDETASVVRAIELGAVDFLPKDFEPPILNARMEAVLAAKRLRDRELTYFRDVDRLIKAAHIIEAGAFRPTELAIEDVSTRSDSLGRLAIVFQSLAQEVYVREKRFDQTARTLRGTILVLIAGLIFGIVPALGRMTAALEVPSLGVVVWANSVAAVACFGIGIVRGGRPKIRKRHLGFFLIWALVLGCFYQIATVTIASHVEASMIALIGSSRGFMVFALAALIAVERPSLQRLLGLGIGFVAVSAVLFGQGGGSAADSILWLGAALLLPMLLAIHTILMTWRPREIDAFMTVGIMMALSTVMLAPVAIATDTMIWPSAGGGRVGMIILVLGLASGVAVALALHIVAEAGAVFAGQIAYSQTLAGIAWGMLLLNEILPLIAWLAFGLVLVGFWLVQPKKAGEEFSATIPIGR
ncbi:response regulator [Aliiroseovarius sp. KMU-50]|uniref:Response regulator n=1 Tax=Aliiroseovarius salicola TaxID=3009082 RepID=A0ABT4VW40_9RHOB|nr:response regulator [Aliiroseovarius sp. KMU-50]MDA5092473.1 response regulator [Aliiroseovarius sp. KMU-50]